MISPLYGQLSPLRIPTRAPRVLSSDADANTYLLAVEAADGQELEAGVITAVETFVLGCKSDGIWSAIKASCILAGARTLSGALVPLVGEAVPTNFNFVSADYNRESGLLGNGTNKYLNSNRLDNADPQNSQHFSVYATTAIADGRTYGGAGVNPGTNINASGGVTNVRGRSSFIIGVGSVSTGFKGVSRESNLLVKARNNSTNYQNTNIASTSPTGNNIHIYARGGSINVLCNARLTFYSIGEAIDLAKLDARVSTLMTDLVTAIP